MSKLQIPRLNLRLAPIELYAFLDNGNCRVELALVIHDAHEPGNIELDRRIEDLDLRIQ